MKEIIEEKNVVQEKIKELINDFLEKNDLEFSSLSYDIDWSDNTPKIAQIKLRVTV